ncbi:methyltransferase domain-containing protein [Alteromonas sp. ASW11-19]|uniref:tRNA 5-carboxymethoxyuridine methyltransferase n=1 Tax=Alteromonas salexigens TaxID=2982530 RepID=A0ABT2VLP4_9ALTE|nr:methyltransferase domain-containing protein [Alteromonas salexigens]MCU7554230.1 methyltransferase domain-containing protein [Alteromonas salexigens]
MSADHHFDGLAGKFSRNIYGTTKGRLRHELLCHAMAPWLPASPTPILELGCGTGEMGLYLANAGYPVTLTDASVDVLENAQALLTGKDNATFRHQPMLDIDDIHAFRFIVCHAVLEWLATPLDALSHLYSKMQPGAQLSLSFFNRDAAVFNNAVYGNFDYIARGMKVKKQVRLNPKQPLAPAEIIAHCEKLGFRVQAKTGIRCFHDYLRDRSMQENRYDEVLALEKQYGGQAPYCWLGRYFHLILQKDG